jgi:uncharacterized protein (TIGR00255 family)
MMQSMTGYGLQEDQLGSYRIKVEIKTLNSKFFDLNPLKIPREISDKENELRNLIQDQLRRGKVSLNIELESEESRKQIRIDEQLLQNYYQLYQSLSSRLGEEPGDLFKLALHSPDVIAQPEEKADISWQALKNVMMAAIDQCNDYRRKEGASLAEKLKSYVATIKEKSAGIEERIPARKERIRSRLDKNLEEIKSRVQVDENRFEQELIYYFEKIDLTEEQVRLNRHLQYFLEVMDMDASGKKLSFICQEMGREINTLGAKAYDADMQQLVVEMKDELEKIKEQLLNIL